MPRRRHSSSGLWWALLFSLLINHSMLLPAAYLLLTRLPVAPLEEKPLEVSLVPLEPPPTPVPPSPVRDRLKRPKPQHQVQVTPPLVLPERPKPEPKPEPKQPQPPPEPPDPTSRLKMVEVNNPESDRPPDNVRFLSDKNRRVEQETRARHTNLVVDHPKPEPHSRANPRKEKDPGSREQQVAEVEQQPRPKKQAHEPKQARRRPAKASPLLAMRRAKERREERKELAKTGPDGDLPTPQRKQRAQASQARRAPQLAVDEALHDRLYGEEARRQRELARLSPSTPRGRHDRKWQRIRSALENFIPEVRPGNQTALGTRADPFALYIARMHRNIHRFWGYGFLVDLDNKPDGHPMNDMRLWAMVEAVVLPNGEVEKATIVKQSGILPYDVAALDTVFSASPYPPTPRAIRSADGKVYLHWRFHRDQRQCGTFGVDPYILTTPPKGPIDGNMEEVGRGQPAAPRRVRRLNRPSGHTVRGRASSRPHLEGKAATRRARGAGARAAAQRFVAAFQAKDAAGMARACSLPFLAQGSKVATSRKQLEQMFGDLVRESRGRTGLGKVMTPMEARGALGRLPPGAAYGEQMMVGQAVLGGRPTTLILQQRSGRWQVVGLNR
jgi:TonB family protein